jgi:hypothetical protein
MGFRGAFITEGFDYHLPHWFVEKYEEILHFGRNNDDGPLSSRFDKKDYDNILVDLSSAIDHIEEKPSTLTFPISITCAILWECGGVDRVKVSAKGLEWSCPSGWEATKGQNHNYCYGCSDV